MGNRLACMSPGPAHSPSTKVFHADTGRISVFHEPLKVAELMLEYTNQFVCHSNALHNGRRISALSADEELKMGQLYILLPMRKLHGRFSPEELFYFSSLLCKSGGGKPLKHSQSKVTPLPRSNRETVLIQSQGNEVAESEEYGVSRAPVRSLSLRLDNNVVELPPTAGPQRSMICRSKSWMPKLETISEMSMLKAC